MTRKQTAHQRKLDDPDFYEVGYAIVSDGLTIILQNGKYPEDEDKEEGDDDD